VELVELQVGHPATRAPGHGNAITAGTVRVAGIEVHLGCATGCQNGEARAKGVDFTRGTIQHIGTEAAITFQAQAAFGNQIDGNALFEQFDIGALAGLFEQCLENRRAGGVGRMDDAPVAVPAFSGEVELKALLLGVDAVIAGEGYALIDQPLDGFAAVLDGKAYRVFVAQPATGIEGVFDVGLHRVGVIQDSGDTALGPERRTIGQIAFAQHCNTHMAG